MFFESLKVANSMVSGKLTTLGLLKIKTFWNIGYDIIVFVPDATNKNFIAWLKLYFRFGEATEVSLF